LPRWCRGLDFLLAGFVIASGVFWSRLWESAAVAAIVAAVVVYLSASGTSRARAAAIAAAGILFPVVPAAFIGLLGRVPEGLAWLLFVFIVVETNDSFALLIGKLFGRHGILPKLSPGKTTEGAIGGLSCGGAVGMVLAMAVFGLPAGQAGACVGVVLAAGLLGDVFTSALKRSAVRKDFASVHVLHGGALDIYDSVVVAAPFFYVYHSLFLR
jgi:phosphatidate cytidylyltransferase